MRIDPNKNLTEAQMVELARNALLVAGEEMGPTDGDHWPVIHSTIHDILLDWEKLQLERRVQEEMKRHLYAQLAEMERILPLCSDEVRAEVAPKLLELREIYDASFEEVDLDDLVLEEMDMPLYIRRSHAIIGSLMSGDGELVLEDQERTLEPHIEKDGLELTERTEA